MKTLLRTLPRLLAMVCALGLLPVCVWAQTGVQNDALRLLEQKTRLLTTVRSDFVQETVIPLFAHPMRSHGRLVFVRPDALRWEYTQPMREGFVLRQGVGFRWDEDKGRSPFTPGSDPVATLIAGQLPLWIMFDRPGIERAYRIESLSERPVRLRMTPLHEGMSSVIESISITFTAEGAASVVELQERRGGRTVITFSHTVINGPVADGEFE